jgi:hypothetical protein
MKKLISLMFLILFTFACAPAPTPKTIVVVVTATPQPATSTPVFTSRLIPTITPTKYPTGTPYIPSTIDPKSTKTPTPTTQKALAVARRDFVTYPDKYTGQYVVVSGIVFNINSNTELQIYMGGDYDSPVYVISAEPYDDIYKDDDVVVYGVVAGSNCGTNAFGSSVCQATINDACIVLHVYQSNNTKNKNGVRPTPDYSTNPCP